MKTREHWFELMQSNRPTTALEVMCFIAEIQRDAREGMVSEEAAIAGFKEQISELMRERDKAHEGMVPGEDVEPLLTHLKEWSKMKRRLLHGTMPPCRLDFEHALSSDAGRDYVPRSDLEEAQRVLRYCEEKLTRKGDHSLPEAVDRWVCDYVPRSEVEKAWRKGMTDAAGISRLIRTSDNAELADLILAARDKKPKPPTQPKP